MGFRSAGSGRSPLSPLTVFESGYAASFYSFPSGHATVAVGFYGTLALLLAWRLSGGWRCAVAATGAFLVLFIGFSRLYLGVHYPTDVAVGYPSAPLSLSVAGGAYSLYRLLREDRRGEARQHCSQGWNFNPWGYAGVPPAKRCYHRYQYQRTPQ